MSSKKVKPTEMDIISEPTVDELKAEILSLNNKIKDYERRMTNFKKENNLMLTAVILAGLLTRGGNLHQRISEALTASQELIGTLEFK